MRQTEGENVRKLSLPARKNTDTHITCGFHRFGVYRLHKRLITRPHRCASECTTWPLEQRRRDNKRLINTITVFTLTLSLGCLGSRRQQCIFKHWRTYSRERPWGPLTMAHLAQDESGVFEPTVSTECQSQIHFTARFLLVNCEQNV